MLKWDGSELTPFELVQTHPGKDFKWLEARSNGIDFRAGYYLVDDVSGCVVDEICKKLRVPSVGTHWTKVSGKNYYLYRIPENVQCITKDSELRQEEMFRTTMQQILVIRELLKAPISKWAIFQVRTHMGCSFPVSTYAKIRPENRGKSILCTSTLENWFDRDQSPAQILKQLFQRYPNPHLIFRTWLEDIVERVDPSLNLIIQPLVISFADFWSTVD